MSSRRYMPVIGVLVVALTGLAALSRLAGDTSTAPARAVPLRQGQPTATLLNSSDDTPEPTGSIPTLSAAEVSTSVAIAAAARPVQTITANHTYTTTVVVWTAEDLTKIGAAIEYELDSPGTYDLNWPYVEYDSSGYPIYPPDSEHYIAVDMMTFTSFVDLNEAEVVQVLPGLEAAIPSPTPTP